MKTTIIYDASAYHEVLKFSLGQTVITKAALSVLTTFDIMYAINRHVTGDWGDLSQEDKELNDAGLSPYSPDRLLSAYKSSRGEKFWIITEYDRSVTTILLPSDY